MYSSCFSIIVNLEHVTSQEHFHFLFKFFQCSICRTLEEFEKKANVFLASHICKILREALSSKHNPGLKYSDAVKRTDCA